MMANTNVLIDICRKTAIENGAIPKLPSGSNSKPAVSNQQKFQPGKYFSGTLRESRNVGISIQNCSERTKSCSSKTGKVKKIYRKRPDSDPQCLSDVFNFTDKSD